MQCACIFGDFSSAIIAMEWLNCVEREFEVVSNDLPASQAKLVDQVRAVVCHCVPTATTKHLQPANLYPTTTFLSMSTASRILTSWINLLYNELKLVYSLPDIDKMKMNTAASFARFSDLHIVVDCTELFTEKPSDLTERKQTFSNCKVQTPPNIQVSSMHFSHVLCLFPECMVVVLLTY